MFTGNPTSFAAIPRPAFGRAVEHFPATPTPAKTKAKARYQHAAKTAAELLPVLPEPGESIHVLMLGTFDLCQVVVPTVQRLPSCRHLRIATLCFSKRNAVELIGLLEARPGMALTLLVSVFFVANNKAGHEQTVAELTAYPNVKMAAARSHCKVVCFDFGERDGLTFEGSANLRGNKNREQLAAFRGRPLHDFHATWIDDLVSKRHAEEDSRQA